MRRGRGHRPHAHGLVDEGCQKRQAAQVVVRGGPGVGASQAGRAKLSVNLVLPFGELGSSVQHPSEGGRSGLEASENVHTDLAGHLKRRERLAWETEGCEFGCSANQPGVCRTPTCLEVLQPGDAGRQKSLLLARWGPGQDLVGDVEERRIDSGLQLVVSTDVLQR